MARRPATAVPVPPAAAAAMAAAEGSPAEEAAESPTQEAAETDHPVVHRPQKPDNFPPRPY